MERGVDDDMGHGGAALSVNERKYIKRRLLHLKVDQKGGGSQAVEPGRSTASFMDTSHRKGVWKRGGREAAYRVGQRVLHGRLIEAPVALGGACGVNIVVLVAKHAPHSAAGFEGLQQLFPDQLLHPLWRE